MNHINKLRNLILNGKFFKIQNHQEKYYIKNILHQNKKSFAIGTSLIGFGFLFYNYNNIFAHGFKIAYCYEFFRPKTDGNKSEEEDKRDDQADKELSKISDKVNVLETKEEEKATPLTFETEVVAGAVSSLPSEVPYLIIGAGVAGMSAARAIRASDPLAKVLIINSECESPGQHRLMYPPYRRILLSKFIWRRSEDHQRTMLDPAGDVKSSSVLFIEPDSFFVAPEKLSRLEYGGISLLNGAKVDAIDPKECSVTLEGSGHKIRFQACLIATGSYPRRLKNLEVADNTGRDLYNDGRVSYFRSLNDFRNLADNIKRMQARENGGGRLLIVGSGLLGSELTSSLGRLAKDQGNLEIIEVFKEKSHLYNLLPEELSLYISRNIASKHTTLISHSKVMSIGEVTEGSDSGRLRVAIQSLSQSDETERIYENVDHVVIAAGVKPDTSLSISAKLETDPILGGFLVNSELQTRAGIFVAGDACSYYDPVLGRRRVEHWNHSEESGHIAGHNMAAYVLKTDRQSVLAHIDRSKLITDILAPKTYEYQSSFAFKLSMFKTIEAVGVIDSSLETRTFIAKDFYDDVEETGTTQQTTEPADALDMPGVVFYLRLGRVVGVLLWNCDDDLVIDDEEANPSPARSNVARKVLAERRTVGAAMDAELRALAADFDLSFFVNDQIKQLKLSKDGLESQNH